MALELIQNADDAGATEILFDVQESGLRVWNSGRFSYCGKLDQHPCPDQLAEGYSCDFHRISDFGSGGKLSHSDNIGRFGIGFSSTYQICDHPEIHSAGIQLSLLPEKGKWILNKGSESSGTTFFLPWASDPNSPGRVALGVSHVTSDHIEQLIEECQAVMRRSLLFLRHLKKATLRRDGEPIFSVEMDRGGNEHKLIVAFEPSEDLEEWYIVRANADTDAVLETYPQLKALDRKRGITIAIRVGPEPLESGLLYAFLPTQQSTGLPLHINADFFPDDSRTKIIFGGHQHQQAWNELLVESAAETLAGVLTELGNRVGYLLLWQLFSAALRVEQDKRSIYPRALKSFWEQIKFAVDHSAAVGYSEKGAYQKTTDLVVASLPLSKQQQSAFHRIGGELVNEVLRPHYNTLIKLGVNLLTLDRFVRIAGGKQLERLFAGREPITIDLREFFIPLWEIIEGLLPEESPVTAPSQQKLRRLRELPLFVDSKGAVTPLNPCFQPPPGLSAEELSGHLPWMRFVHDELTLFSRIMNFTQTLTIRVIAAELEEQLSNSDAEAGEIIGSGRDGLQGFYKMLALIDSAGEEDADAYDQLRRLPIWKSGGGFTTLQSLMLPGNFEDPTGRAMLVDTGCLSLEAITFMERRLGVKRQSIEETVRTVVPEFFAGDGPEDIDTYRQFLLALADHASLLDNDEIFELLSSTPLVPSADGRWRCANQLYYRTDVLAKTLGEHRSRWVDERRLPSESSVHAMVESLGVLKTPTVPHLVDRILAIASASPPDTKAREESKVAFYSLCSIFDESGEGDVQVNDLYRLVSVPCLPALGDNQRWYMPEELYAPFRYKAFQSQASILDFKNTQKLNSELLDKLSIKTSPETALVIDHLIHCVERVEPVSTLVYTVLDDRASQGDSELDRLKGRQCIYLENQKRYLRPNQLYRVPQQLGRYSYTVPGGLEQYRKLFDRIGVRSEPEPRDYIDIILDIVEESDRRQGQLPNEDKAIYLRCMGSLVQAWTDEEIDSSQIDPLRNAPTILGITGLFRHPDETLLLDSEWHAKQFQDELDPMLCRPEPGWRSFFSELGVKHLSECATVDLDYVDGDEYVEEEIKNRIVERSGLLIRLLHDQSSGLRNRLEQILQGLSVVSHDGVRIIATVRIGETEISSPSTAMEAYCDKAVERLVVASPFGKQVWLHIYSMLLHRLLPEETASDVVSISMNLAQLMNMTVSEGDEFLTAANIPRLEQVSEEKVELDLRSQVLGDIGDEEDGLPEGNEAGESVTQDQQDKTGRGDSGNYQLGDSKGELPGDGKGVRPRGREHNKQARARRLVSYVKQRLDDGKESVGAELDQKYRLSIEAASRSLVGDYERDRGREPEEMAQDHPGFDVISRLYGSDEIERYIEIKGTSGEWGSMGVSVSRLQFSNAQDYGNRYWLYVVEHVMDQSAARIHVIQNPAMKVDSFMFDGGWRDAAADEAADPTLRYRVGVKVDCGQLGVGTISSVDQRGKITSLLIDFGEGRGNKSLALNLNTMKIIEDENEPNHP